MASSDVEEEAWIRWVKTLGERFLDSPESDAFEDTGWVEIFFEYVGAYHSVALADLTPAVLTDVVLVVFPRKVVCEPDEAPEIVAVLRAFFRFATREWGMKSAPACLAALDDALTEKLRARLADKSAFGMAKALFAGVDSNTTPMDVERLVDEFFSSRLREGLDGPIETSAARARDGRSSADAKKARKREKAARKKNRRR